MISLPSQAQIKFGVRAGVSVADLSFDSDVFNSSNITGFSGGLAVDFKIPVVGLGVSSGLLYTQRGGTFKIPSNIDEAVGTFTSKDVRIGYLDIPVFLKWNFSIPLSPVGVFIQGGPYFSLALDDKDAKDIKEAFGSFNNFDTGLGLGAGVSLFSKLEVGAYYGWGLTKVYDNGDVKNRGWNITAAYFF